MFPTNTDESSNGLSYLEIEMNAVLEEKNEVPACACDDPIYKLQMEGLKQMTATINDLYAGISVKTEDESD
jgi:hypothetical protein